MNGSGYLEMLDISKHYMASKPKYRQRELPGQLALCLLFKSLLEAGSTTVGPASSRPKTPLGYLAAYLTFRVLSSLRVSMIINFV